MGAVHFSLDKNLVKVLKSILPLDVFVETGTFKGDTVEQIKELFDEIYTVELSKDYYNYCKERFKDCNQINLHHDNSPIFLKKLRKSIARRSVIYFLDAHWCVADNTAGEKSQCPLLKELKAIKTLNNESVIIIDDARLFIAPPPVPHEISHWPDFGSVVKALKSLNSRNEVMIVNDTILFFPPVVKNKLKDYAYTNSIDLLAILHKVKDYENLRKQFESLEKQLLEKETIIFAQVEDLNNKEKRIVNLSFDLIDKEKEIEFLSDSLSILKRRLSNPFIGLITLFQHNFPGLWNYVYNKKQAYDNKREEKRKQYPLSFFTPRLGKLYHHRPIDLEILPKYTTENLKTEPLKLSVVTPSFNQGDYLKKTIESVIKQNYGNLEYIIQDSCSTDNTKNVLENVNNKNIKFYIEKDKGQADAINKGFQRTTGEIMAWINSDDIYLPGTFNYVVNYFNKNPNVDVVYGHRILIDTNDKEIGRWVLPKHDKKVLYYADFIPQETLFWRREIWKKVGASINFEYNFALDWDLLLRFQESGAKIVRLPRFLAAFRIHPNQKTSSQIDSLGEKEMNFLRNYYLGKDHTNSEIKKEIIFYLFKSELLNKLYHLKLLKY
jgi:glycosyltransferase involved in cell wall biosynthesis